MLIKRFSLFFLFSFFCSFPQFAFSGDLGKAFQQLKNTDNNYLIAGTVCEQVARLMFEEYYPTPDYEVETGIEYTNQYGQILGELDLVIFDNNTHKALIVGEVKCRKNLKEARAKAENQLERVDSDLHHRKNLNFYLANHKEHHFSPRQFDNDSLQLISISQKGGERAGFEYTLDYSLDELMQLRSMLISTQN